VRLITGSLTPSVIGDRPSHPISKPLNQPNGVITSTIV